MGKDGKPDMLYKYFSILLLVSLLTSVVGCRAYSPPAESSNSLSSKPAPITHSPPQTPLIRKFQEASLSTPAKKDEPKGNLTLRQAAALALLKNPTLAAFSQEIRVQEARVLQAGLLPNPRLSVQGSNLGNATLKGPDGASTTVQLSQLILLGGKIAKRIKAAQLTQDLAGWDYETKRVNVLTQVAQSFIAVLSAQRRLALVQQLVSLAQQVATTVSKRVQAGKISPVEETKAQVALSSVHIQLTRAERNLTTARKQLAATWGSTTPHFQQAAGQMGDVASLPSLEQLTQLISQNPDLARWTTEIAQRQAFIHLEKSKAIPDITVNFGGTEYANTGDYALLAGISIPLMLFDRNQGSILAAERQLTKAEEARRAAQVQVATALSTAYQRLAAAHAEATILKTQILPGAQNAFDAVNKGFRLGKFAFLSVLDAQRTLFDSKSQYLRALTDYHQAAAEVERLIGEPLETARAKGE
ncbi:outer membrane efflux protein [Nitrosococcus watsonii C-113]|uniref:Outer membrane efflux protein n=2 Tax=Nitrosococcus TaxID=1227 RepID=D8K6M2_NITWC|nr:outer membrane efflux protein [Nitrosococcus watsonii C-113]